MQNESYLGLPIFRFYIKCTRCLAEITFKVGGQPGWSFLPWGSVLLSSPSREIPFHLLCRKQQRFGEKFTAVLFIKAKNQKQPRCTVMGFKGQTTIQWNIAQPVAVTFLVCYSKGRIKDLRKG